MKDFVNEYGFIPMIVTIGVLIAIVTDNFGNKFLEIFAVSAITWRICAIRSYMRLERYGRKN